MSLYLNPAVSTFQHFPHLPTEPVIFTALGLFCFLFLCVWGNMSGKGKICPSFQMLQSICSLRYIHIFSVFQPSNLSALAEHCHQHLYSSNIPATTILSGRWPGPSVSLTWWGNSLDQFLSPGPPQMGRCMASWCLLLSQSRHFPKPHFVICHYC